MSTPPELRARVLRDYAAATFLTVAATALLLFLILRIAAPWLVDLHQTAALWLAAALLAGCPLVLLYAGWMLWVGRRRLQSRLAVLPL